MNWIKQKWFTVLLGILLGALFFVNEWNDGLSDTVLSGTISSSTPEPTSDTTLEYSMSGYGLLDAIDKADSQFKSVIRISYPSGGLSYQLLKPPYALFGKGEKPYPTTPNGKIIAFSKDFGNYSLQALREQGEYDYIFEVGITQGSKQVAVTKTDMGDFVYLYELSYEDKSIYLFQGWSGGTHCCTTLIPAVFDGKILQVGKAMELGDNILMDDEDYSKDFFIKDGHLYWVTQESRFVSNYGSMNQGTWVFPLVVYRLDGSNFVPAMSEFKELYDEEYQNMTDFIVSLKEDAHYKIVIDKHKNDNDGFNMTSDIADALVALDRRFILGLYSNKDTKSLVDDYINDSKYFFGDKESGGIEYLREILNGLAGKGSLIYNEDNNLLNIAPKRKI